MIIGDVNAAAYASGQGRLETTALRAPEALCRQPVSDLQSMEFVEILGVARIEGNGECPARAIGDRAGRRLLKLRHEGRVTLCRSKVEPKELCFTRAKLGDGREHPRRREGGPLFATVVDHRYRKTPRRSAPSDG